MPGTTGTRGVEGSAPSAARASSAVASTAPAGGRVTIRQPRRRAVSVSCASPWALSEAPLAGQGSLTQDDDLKPLMWPVRKLSAHSSLYTLPRLARIT